jgi:hypothetical protein
MFCTYGQALPNATSLATHLIDVVVRVLLCPVAQDAKQLQSHPSSCSIFGDMSVIKLVIIIKMQP